MRVFLEISGSGEIKNLPELALALAPLAGRWVQIEAKPLAGRPDELVQEKARTLEQNNYYWGVVVPAVSNYTGFTPEETHEALKEKYLTVKTRLRWDRRRTLSFKRSTTSLITREFADFVLRVRRDFGAEIDGQRYSVVAAPNQPVSRTENGEELFLVDPQELARL